MINEMETISITYRGIVHKLTEYEKLVDTIEMIYTMCDQKITHWADSITGKNGGKVKKYKRGKILYNSLKNDNLERVSFFSLPEDFVTAAFDYTIYISINYKDKYITAVFEKNVLKNEKIESIKMCTAQVTWNRRIQKRYILWTRKKPLYCMLQKSTLVVVLKR
ncbi:MAG: hypothetical protein ACLUVD_06005 [Mediterraneibacter faecis]